MSSLKEVDGLVVDEEVVDAAAKTRRVSDVPLGKGRLPNLLRQSLYFNSATDWLKTMAKILNGCIDKHCLYHLLGQTT